MRNSKTLKLAYMAILTSISIIFMLIVRFPIIPSASFLKFDICDVPLLIACFYFSKNEPIIMLLAVCIIESFCFSSFGLIGAIAHFFSSAVLIILVSLFKAFKKSFYKSLINLILILFILEIFVLPFNYFVFKYIFMFPQNVILNLLFTAVLPFNIIKSSANYIIALIVINLLKINLKFSD